MLKKLFFLVCYALGSIALLTAQPLLRVVDLATIPDPVLANQSYNLKFKVINAGTTYLVNETIQLRLSVNGDAGTAWGAMQLGSLAPNTDTLTINLPNYQFESQRFAGGGANDIIVWPTVISNPTTPFDSLIKTVVFVDAAAFRVNNQNVGGLGTSVHPNTNYSIIVKAQNVGINLNQNAINYFVQLDDLTPVLIGELNQNLNVGDFGIAEVQSFNISQLYPNVLLNSGSHSVQIWAEEKGKSNAVAKGTFPVGGGTFPVSLDYYDAVAYTSNNNIKVFWETSQEINNKMFVVEKYNTQTEHFDTLGQVEAHGAHIVYEIIDNTPDLNLNTYRLLQIDVDGTTRILGTQSVNYQVAEAVRLLNVHPIPTRDRLTVTLFNNLSAETLIEIYDIKGCRVLRENYPTNTGTQSFELNIENLPVGVYTYKVSNPYKLWVGKIIKE